MREQRHAADDPEYGIAEIVWPPGIVQPARPPRLLYLDLNHWIGLAKARKTSGDDAYSDLLAALTAVVCDGRAKIVLSASLFREIGKILDPAQRTVLTVLVEELSGFTYLAGLPDILKMELQAALDARTGTSGIRYSPINLLGATALHAMGKVGGLRFMRDDVDVTTESLANNPALQEKLAELERLAERMLLAGPSDEDVPSLRENGYRPEIPKQSIRDNAVFEQEWGKQAVEYKGTHYLRDLVIARHLSLELLDPLIYELAVRGIQLRDIFDSCEQGREFVLCMPSSVVIVSMTAQYHQDQNRAWTQNDVYDIDALAVAVPYCDIVFTDAAARDALLRRDLDVKLNTAIPRRTVDLIAILDSIPPA